MKEDVKKRKKIFVLDTNVPLYNWKCLYSFEEHDIKLSTEVFQELDTFKDGSQVKNYNARHFTRAVDLLRAETIEKEGKIVSKLSSVGVSLGKGLGTIQSIAFDERDYNEKVSNVFTKKTVDNSLLSLTYTLKEKNPDCDVILVTKDINLRLKADSLNIVSEDYKKDQLKDIDTLDKGILVLNSPFLEEIIDKIYLEEAAPYNDLDKSLNFNPKNNLYVILKSGQKSVLTVVNMEEERFVRVHKITNFGITPRNAEQVFAMHAVSSLSIKLVTLYGPAGSGKTLMALAAALQLLKMGVCKKIICSAAIVAVDNKELGYLPGDMFDKVSPYMGGVYDNLSLIKTHINKNGDQKYLEIYNSDKDSGYLVIQPLAFIRGKSINDSVFILDEAQNTTPHEVLAAITRAGENTKVILCGDIKQVDAPYLGTNDNGLVHVISRFQGQKVYANVFLEKGERSYLATLASELLSN